MESQDTTTPVLLLLYEFEARSKLGDKGAEGVLESAIFLPNAEPKVFESIAGKYPTMLCSQWSLCAAKTVDK